MARRQGIRVSFTPEQARFLAACVSSGRYQSASEVVREAVRLLEDRLHDRATEIERVRGLMREGAEQIDRGEVVDAETFFAEWDAELEELERAERQGK